MGFLDDIGGSLSVINPIAMIANAATQPGMALLNARETSKNNDRMEQNHWEDLRLQREDNNTAVQRRAKDMQAAGINPLLAAGDGANSVNGSSPSMVAPQITAPDILPALQFAETMRNNKADRDLKDAQTRQIRQSTNIKSPIEAGTNAIKGYSDFIKDWFNDDEKPNYGHELRPIKKNPNKKTQQFQNFWQQRSVPMPKNK